MEGLIFGLTDNGVLLICMYMGIGIDQWIQRIIYGEAQGGLLGAVLGATVIDSSDDNYCWVQFKGPKAMLISNAALVQGQNVVRSTNDAGGVQAAASDILYPVGQAMATTVVDTEYGMVWLNI